MNKSFLWNAEYDFLRENEHLDGNIILLGLGGSHAYGTNIATSDIDLRGVATKRAEEILTGTNFEQVTDEKTDTTIYSLEKYISLASNCNPNVIELLGLRSQDYFYKNDIGERLLKNKDMFLSNRCIGTFGGYATSQLYRLKQKMVVAMTEQEFNKHIEKVIFGMKEHLYNEIGIEGVEIVATPNGLVANIKEQKDVPVENLYAILSEINNVLKEYSKKSKRNENAIRHEKIEKHGLHLLRLFMMAEDLLLKGEIVTYREKEHDLLMSIRNKDFTTPDGQLNHDFFKLVEMYEKRFDYAKAHSILPDKPNYKRISSFLEEVNREIVSEKIKEYER